MKDKTFWFFTYEGQRERVGVTSINSVPTLANFQTAVVALGGNGAACATGAILNCITSQPAGVINSVTRNLFNFCNTNGGCSGDHDVWPLGTVSSARAFNDADSFIIKLDHTFNERHSITGRYFRGTSDQSFPLGLAGGNNLPNTNTFSPIKAQLISVSYVEVINPRWVNEARFGWNLYEQDFFPQDADVFGNPNSSIGLNNGVTNPRDFGLPTIRVSGLAALGSAPYSNPRGRDDTNWHFIEGMSYKLTRHDLKWGYEFRRTSVDSFYDAQFRGVLNFDSLTEFLAGNISGGRIVRGNTDRQARQNSHALYFQDTWRVWHNVTVNLGLRWDYFGVIKEKQDRFSVYRPNQGLVLMSKLYESDLDNFSPRVSAAWDLGGKGKTVVRAGFGAFYDLFAQDFFTGQIPFNCFSCPGVAYNPTGPDPVLLSLSPIGTLAPGAAIFPAATDNFDVFTVDNLRTPYVLNWTLNVQQQVGNYGVFQVGYVGTGGRKLFRMRDINAPSAATIRGYDYATNSCCVPRLFDSSANLDPNFAPNTPFYVNQLETASTSTYNAMQTSFQMRNWRGLTQQINYTWSHSIDDASDGQDFVPNASMPQDSQNASGNRGDSNFDTRHHFAWSATYSFPKCERCGEWLGNGWQISSVVSLQSGRPFHVNYNFLDDYDGSGTFFGRPDITAAPQYNRSDPRQFLNLGAFTVPCMLNPAGAGFAQDCTFTAGVNSMHFGSLGRNALIGPSFRNWDFSLIKDTKLTERFKLHARVDFFNFTNHPNFSNPFLPTFFADAAPNGIDPATGRSIGFLPITATVDTGLGNPILGGGGPRSVQFALKLLF